MLEQWILPVYDETGGDICGQCFIIGSYIITAAHVVECAKEPYVNISHTIGHDLRIYLRREKAFVYVSNCSNNEKLEDCAIYTLPTETESPLQLTDISTIDKDLNCYYVEENIETTTSKIGVFSHSYSKQLNCSTVQHKEILSDRVFVCNVIPMLKKGHSGCPIMTKDCKVVGFLHGGNDINTCVFQSAAFIKALINHE